MGLGKKKIQLKKELKGEPVVRLDEEGNKIKTYRERQAEYERKKALEDAENFRSIFR